MTREKRVLLSRIKDYKRSHCYRKHFYAEEVFAIADLARVTEQYPEWGALEVYPCKVCPGFHLGHKR